MDTRDIRAHEFQGEHSGWFSPCIFSGCQLPHVVFPSVGAVCRWNMLMALDNGWKYLGLRGQPSIDRMPKVLNRAETHICYIPEERKGVCVLRDAPKVLKDGVFDAYAASFFKDPATSLATLADFESLVKETRALRFSVVKEMLGDTDMPLELLIEDIRDQWGVDAVVSALSSIAPDLTYNVPFQEAVQRFHDNSVNEESIRMAASAYARLDRQDAKKTTRSLISVAGISLRRALTVSWTDQNLENWHKGVETEFDAYLKDHPCARSIAVIPAEPGYRKYWLFGVSAVTSFWTDWRGLHDVVYEAGKHKSTLLRDYLTNAYFHPGDARYLSFHGTEYTLKECRNPRTKQNFTDKDAALLGTLLDARK